MHASFNRSATRASWTLFQGLFFIAALLAVFVTFSAISGVSPVDPTRGRIAWLLGFNTLLIAILAWLVVRRYRAMRGHRAGRNRLARRFLLMFSAAAVIPAALVAIFLGAMITRGLDNWFNERIDTIVEETAEVARRNFDAFSSALDEDVRLMAKDLNNAAEGLRTGNELYPSYLKAQAALREFSMAHVVNRSGQPIASAELDSELPFLPPSEQAFAEADAGDIAQTLYERSGLATGLMALTENENAYLYVAKSFDPRQLVQMRRAEAALRDYRAAKTRSGRLQWLFAVGYAQLAGLVLLLSGRLALEAAGRITGPIGRLADAALAVRDGELSVHVPVPRERDEVADLTRSFNAMTERLAAQRGALVAAREEAEDRRVFVETLLSEVSAGVVRTDADLSVTLANPSAEQLLGAGSLQGRLLGDVAPDFEPYARQVLERGTPVDAFLDIRFSETLCHFRLKAALDPSGGCVLTFDDASRLVAAQRQLAWRDVARRIAHEIRNPLTPIQLSAERLRRRYGAKLDEQDDGVFERCVDTILRQVTDIGRMVEEFSNFARMPKPSVARFDMGNMLATATFSQAMVTPDLNLDLDRPDTPVPFLGDERLLAQAFGNLMRNGADAIARMPEESETMGRIDVSLVDRPGHEVEVVIEDNGPGFPKTAREQLMEPYVTTREKGTGLGLAIVNRVIMDHGGTITLENRPDGRRGARVRVVLPHLPDGDGNDGGATVVEESVA